MGVRLGRCDEWRDMTAAPHAISVLLVDDDPETLQGSKSLLNSDERIGVVREALSVGEAIDRLRVLHPDVVMLDVGLAQNQTKDTTRVLKSMLHDARIIVIADPDELESSESLSRLGFQASC